MRRLFVLIATSFLYLSIYSQDANDFERVLSLSDYYYPQARWSVEKFVYMAKALQQKGYSLINMLSYEKNMICCISRKEDKGTTSMRILDFRGTFPEEVFSELYRLSEVPFVDHLLTFLEYAEDISYQYIHRLKLPGLTDQLSESSKELLLRAQNIDSEVNEWLNSGNDLSKQQIIDFFYLISTWDKKFDLVSYEGIYYMFLKDEQTYKYGNQSTRLNAIIFPKGEYHLPIFPLVWSMDKITVVPSSDLEKYMDLQNHIQLKKNYPNQDEQYALILLYK